jgi:hypothetical protein
MRRVSWFAVLATLALPGAAQAARTARSWPLKVAGAGQFDLTEAQVRFSLHGARRPSLGLALDGTAGLNYVAAALPRHQPAGGLRALVVVVNRRPRGSLAPDLAFLRLTAKLGAPLRAPSLAERSNPFSGLNPQPPTRLCDLAPAGQALSGSDLRAVLESGSLPGFAAASAVAQGWNAACDRPVDPAFRSTVHPG